MGLFDDQAKPPEPKHAEPERPPEPTYGVKIEYAKAAEERISMTAGESREYELLVSNTGNEDDTIKVKVDLNYASEAPEPPEWTIKLWGVEEKVWDVTFTKITEKEFVLIGGGSREITLQVTCPKGARYGDKLTLIFSTTSKNDPAVSDSKTILGTARQAIIAVKTSIGHERTVADAVFARAKARDIGVFSILVPVNLRGYVLVESMNPDRLEEVIRGIRRARGIVESKGEKAIQFTDIEMYLAPKPIVSGMMEGDIVELMAGPFKGEKARVMKIDETKEEVTVELFEAMVRIPVTVPVTQVRVLQKEEEK
ncbi:MAG: transcription elongation factor Spt5 [Candidatus Thermoplasmatota archaeon]